MKINFVFLFFFFSIGKAFSQQEPFEAIEFNYDSLVAAGENFIAENKPDSAKYCFKYAVITDSNRVEAYYGLGFLAAENCHNSGYECDKAIQLLKRTKALDSNYRRIDYNLAVCYLKRKYYEEALQYINLAIAKNNADADYFATRRDIFASLGNKKAARKDNRKYKKLLRNR